MDIIIDQTKIKTKGKKTKKSHSFKKKKAKSILVQHGGREYHFDNLIGIKSEGQMSCWLDSGIQMLWNIDCLRAYLLNTTEEKIKALQLMSDSDIQNNKKKEENRFTKLFEENYSNLYKKIKDNNFSLKFDLTKIEHKTADNIETKCNMILALKRIIEAYSGKVDYVTDRANNYDEIKTLISDPEFTNNTEKFKSKLLEHNFFVDMTNENLQYAINEDPVTNYLNYVKSEDGNSDQGDPIKFIELIFLLFEHINADDVITLIKCFRCGILNVYQQTNSYEIIYRNTIEIVIIEEDVNTNIQDNINKTYISSDDKRLLLFTETKFILIEIIRTQDKAPVKANAIINITTNTYTLRGCIMVIPGHVTFIAYNDKGEKAALLNGTMKTDLTAIKGELYVNHIGNNEDNNPDIHGVLYLYERIDGSSSTDGSTSATDVAQTLAASLATTTGKEEDIIESDIAASALTATLAATQVTDSRPEALPLTPINGTTTIIKDVHPKTTTIAPPPTKTTTIAPPPPKTTTIAPPPPPKTTTIAPPPTKTTTIAPPPKTTTIAPPTQPAAGKADAGRVDTIKREATDKPEVLGDYNGSLQLSSSDSSGENMVLGVLLVITIAISGVLFVQR